jgi:hypothetical protein
MRVDTPVIDYHVPEDDRKYFGFPFNLVFDASIYILEQMGLRISYSNIYKGRIIAARGPTKGSRVGHLDIKLIGRGSVTLVHVRTGSGTISTLDDMPKIRRHFLWRLDEWLHNAKVEQLAQVKKMAASSHGKPDDTWVPPSTAYKIRSYPAHPLGDRPNGHLVWVPERRSPGSGRRPPSGASAGLRGWWDPNPTTGGSTPSRGHRFYPPRSGGTVGMGRARIGAMRKEVMEDGEGNGITSGCEGKGPG